MLDPGPGNVMGNGSADQRADRPPASQATVGSGLVVRVLGASAVLALIVGASFSILLGAIFQQRHTASLALHSQLVLASASRLERLVVDLENGPRGYLLTGQEKFLDPWTAARRAVPAQDATLLRLIHMPALHARALRITRLIDDYIVDYSAPLVAQARRGDPNARSVQTTDEGKRRVDQIRTKFQELAVDESRLARQRDANSASTAQRSVTLAASAMAISVALIAAVAVYLTRSIVRPVRRAALMADRLAGGDLSTRIPETAVGEIRQLEHSFDELGGSLECSRDQLGRLLAEQAALRRVATLVARGETPAAVFTAVVAEAGKVLGVDGARMLRLESDDAVTVVASWGRSGPGSPEFGVRTPLAELVVARHVVASGNTARRDAAAESLTQGQHMLAVGAPIVVEGRAWGVMITLSERTRPPPPEAEERLAQFTDLVATAISNSQARVDLAASRARLVTAGDQARRRIQRDLHDGTQQRLVSLALDVRTAEAGVSSDQAELRAQLAAVSDGLAGALDELREVARGIHPAILSEGGLAPALRALARRSAVQVELTEHVPGRCPPAVEIAAYYAVAEALTNVAKHADASRVRLDATEQDDRLVISIGDDGVGGADLAAGSGLIGLTDRIEALGGRIVVTSSPGRGTTLRVELPTDIG
ncbi:MAG TPA: CHASE3 domain-containing protein [Pseudonocardiaceae bacterium]|nr:CHASE3 domain-containing protein [Pseudonocardiaceae bacterium]